MKDSKKIVTLLNQVGLNDLEANIYIWLMQNKKSTGYKVAKGLNKPVANTYKALNSLEEKGAVICDDSLNKKYYENLPIKEFLNKKENEFKQTRNLIQKEIEKIDSEKTTGGIYRINSKELVYEKAISLIATTEDKLLIDSFPVPLKRLKKRIENEKVGKKKFYLKSYDDESVENVHQIRAINGKQVLRLFKGQWLIMIRDTEESLIAFFDRKGDRLIHCVWIKDVFISYILFNGSVNEFNLIEIFGKLYSKEDNKIDKIKSIVNDYQEVYEIMTNKQENITETEE